MPIAELNSARGMRTALAAIKREQDTHAGLWLDKGLSVMNPASDADKQQIRALLIAAAGTPRPDGYQAAFDRRRELLENFDGGIEGGRTLRWEATVRGRMILGLGTESLRETSITLQHTWGVPVVPGSALKGLAAATAHHFGGPAWAKGPENGTPGEDHRTLFGDTTTAGVVVFHDAWWMPKENDLPLDLDVMTVHHAEYYGKGEEAPADWDEPNPVAFLTARGSYLVALSGPDAWVECAAKWLERGLENVGVGAKTAAGYGRMTLKRLRSAREKQHEDIRLGLKDLAKRHGQPGTARDAIPALERALDAGLPEQEVHAAARTVWAACPSFWKKQRNEGKELERLDRVGLVPPGVGETASGGAPVSSAAMMDAVAWAGKDGKHAAFVVQLGNRRYKRRQDRFTLDPTTEKALKEATEKKPLPVKVVLDGETIREIKS